jgi:hypothetical protein
MKKPISGKPEIGAQFVSFNFPNNLIWRPASTTFATDASRRQLGRMEAGEAAEGCGPADAVLAEPAG